MIVGGHKVWAVRWVDEQFSVELKQLLVGEGCDVGSGVVKEKADRPVARASPVNLTEQKIQFAESTAAHFY